MAGAAIGVLLKVNSSGRRESNQRLVAGSISLSLSLSPFRFQLSAEDTNRIAAILACIWEWLALIGMDQEELNHHANKGICGHEEEESLN